MKSRIVRRQTPAWLRLRTLIAVGMVLALASILVGCSSGDDTTTSAVPTTAAGLETTTTEAVTTTALLETTTTEAATTTTTEALSNAELLQPDGTIKVMGYIDRVWEKDGTRYISIDYAQMLGGEDARQAAIADGVIGPDDELDNDYYIVNDNTKKREFAVSGSATFSTSTLGGVMEQPATWAEFKSYWGATPPEGAEHLKQMPWWIVRQGTVVQSIDEQYLP